MPQLVQGHLRFTADDFTLTDLQDTVSDQYKTVSFAKLVARLKAESEQLALMRDPDVLALFNTAPNIKHSLRQSLALITALALKEGYTLTELLASQTAKNGLKI
jgi:hypothetical protein